ncbi:hypothetical protein VTO73DRAFT_325 [Trametes versicolor]
MVAANVQLRATALDLCGVRIATGTEWTGYGKMGSTACGIGGPACEAAAAGAAALLWGCCFGYTDEALTTWHDPDDDERKEKIY